MPKSREEIIRGRLRAAMRSNSTTHVLSDLRYSTTSSNYRLSIRAFKRVASLEAGKLLCLGRKGLGELIWDIPLAPVSLKSELAWASAWLAGQSAKINNYRCFVNELQGLVLAGDLGVAATRLDAFCTTKGWSLWAVELRLALEQQTNGTEAQKSLAAAWQATVPNKLVGLIVRVASDRNDATFSYDAFYWKCQESFPRITDDGVPTYLLYRSLAHVDNPEKSLPLILSRELTSSLIDYYEAVIETLYVIASDEDSLAYLRLDAIRVIDSLTKDGCSDSRLQKIRVVLTGVVSHDVIGVSEHNLPLIRLVSDACTARLRWNEIPSDLPPFLQAVLGDIRQCQEVGIHAQEAITRLIKLGVNLKGLDIGASIALSAQYQTRDITSGVILPLAIIFIDSDWEPDDTVALNNDTIDVLLKLLTQDSCCPMRIQAEDLVNVLNGQSVERIEIGASLLYLWLGLQLVTKKRWSEASWLCNRLSTFGPFWHRQSAKIHLSALISEGKLESALDLSVQWLLKDPRYASEFPVERIFSSREWFEFADLDPVLVGLVSHHAHMASEDQDIFYICKMACRRLALNGGRAHVAERYLETQNEAVRAKLLVFMRDVWVEENLTLNHLLESTDDVRIERMQVMQLLMQWDDSNSAYYADAIKDLTFDQTLRKGLRQIDQTRVFVNEAALYRWAEKELYHDYERWAKLLDSNSNAILIDDLVRQYVVDSKNLSLLLELGRDKPTEADALLVQMLERLFKRFLLDPNEGLDCYLSLRIRHGSLRGTLFGALEEQGLLYSSTGFSQSAFEKRWGRSLNLSEQNRDSVLIALETFTTKLKSISDELINERVQIYSDEKPKGGIPSKLAPTAVRLFAVALSDRDISFQSLVYNGFFAFWKFVEPHLSVIGEYIRQDVKVRVQEEFDTLFKILREIGSQTIPLMTTLRTVATTTQSQCDTIADWFKLPGQFSGGDNYELSVAIEIAKTATKNVYRAFPAEVRLGHMPEKDLPLSTSGLSVMTDCLFIVFENAWKHSGLREGIGTLDLDASFDVVNKLLTLEVSSDLSEIEIEELRAGKLERIKTKYLSQDQTELARREGGSGFAKLARLARPVNRTLVSQPLAFDIIDQRWVIKITIPLYEREGLYDAYE